MSTVDTYPSAADAKEAEQKLGLLKHKLRNRDMTPGSTTRTSVSRNRQRQHMNPCQPQLQTRPSQPDDHSNNSKTIDSQDAAAIGFISSSSTTAASFASQSPLPGSATNSTPLTEYPDEYPDEEPGPCQTCPHCSRSFANPLTFEKHIKSCAKVFMKKREAYDSSAQRLAAVEGATLAPPTAAKKKAAKKDFRAQSNAFRAMIAAARATDPAEVEKAQAVLSALPPDPTKVTCPHCDRKFNAESAERHINVCARVFSAKPKGKAKAEASTAASSSKAAQPKAKTKAKSKGKPKAK